MDWARFEREAVDVGTTARSVLREYVQKAILTVLAREGCFEHVVFMGGTALRIFHGNTRYSEDIDLVVRDGVGPYSLTGTVDRIPDLVKAVLPFIDGVEVRVQKDSPERSRFLVSILSDNNDQRVRVNLELASVASYDNRPMILDFPPFNPAIRVETVEEILADKACALVLRPYIKGRDLWDIHLLAMERKVEVDWKMAERKVHDYGGDTDHLDILVKDAQGRIISGGGSSLEMEMTRFLPATTLGIYRPMFPGMVTDIAGWLEGWRSP